MGRIEVKQRHIGVNYTNNNIADITVWSPSATSIKVSTGETSIELNKTEYGYWNIKTEKIQPGCRYKVQVDEKELPYERISILFNFPQANASIHVPECIVSLSVLSCSTDKQWNGDGCRLKITNDKFYIPKESVIILKSL